MQKFGHPEIEAEAMAQALQLIMFGGKASECASKPEMEFSSSLCGSSCRYYRNTRDRSSLWYMREVSIFRGTEMSVGRFIGAVHEQFRV